MATPSTPSCRTALSAASRFLRAAVQNGNREPLVAFWQEWRAAFRASLRAARTAQRLERRLIERIGMPGVDFSADGSDGAMVRATHPDDIDRILGPEPAGRERGGRLKRELAVAQARWDTEAEASGLVAAIADETAADHRGDGLMRAIPRMPARPLAEAIAKLAVLVEWSGTEPEDGGIPRHGLHGLLADLVALAPPPR